MSKSLKTWPRDFRGPAGRSSTIQELDAPPPVVAEVIRLATWLRRIGLACAVLSAVYLVVGSHPADNFTMR